MSNRTNTFTTLRTEGALLPADLLLRIRDNKDVPGLTPDSYHHGGEKLNEAINRSWNALQAAWANFKTMRERLPETDAGTTLTRERWLMPVFRELEYGRLQTAAAVQIDGRTYAISHGWEHVPIHLVSYKADLDKRASNTAGASTTNPHSLLQVFLNRSDAHLWGFVSNGLKLRILRDNVSLTRPAYLEFDLEAMMDGEVYSDFVLFWLICHQSRIEGERPSDCWLEKWMKDAEDKGTRALEDLRQGVEEAINALGVGFLAYPANAALREKLSSGALDNQEYYRQLLRMVYRLLFLFVAEDRDLLLKPSSDEAARERYIQYYSTQRLRQIAETFKGTRHPDLYEGLRVVMQLLSGEKNGAGAALGLAPLGSFLFSDAAVTDIITSQISNIDLLNAIRALSLTYDDKAKVYRSVDYRNLGPEELGSVYESLLELHPQINLAGRTFALATAGGNERKTTGSYYTPTSLINALLDSALDPVLAEAAKKGEAAVLALKICDPACGSGHFLIAAANRIAKALAVIRTGEEEPSPAAVQTAKRDVIAHCIYGVDINPMAVELCKVNLWMEALEPGKPLGFLDHHIQVGNSLLGTTPRLMQDGIPDDAFSPIEGDDKAFVAQMKKVNKQERTQRAAKVRQMGLFDQETSADYAYLTRAMHALDTVPDATLYDIRRKEAEYAALANNPEYIKARLLADAWCAAFVWEKRPLTPNPSPTGGEGLEQNANAFSSLPMTDLLYRRLESDPFADNLQSVREQVVKYAQRYQFFHWHVAFPDVFPVEQSGTDSANPQTGWYGGFDCILGNPPWERIKIQEKEWFAQRAPAIANAANAAARRKAIAELEQSDPYLLYAFAEDKRKAEGESHFVRVSERYPLCGRGDVNTYTIFAETSRHVISGRGRVGMIVPSGIATDDTTKFFFQDLMQTHSLASLYDFENREKLFPTVDSRMKFSLVTITGSESISQEAEFVFFALNVSDLKDEWRCFTLSAQDIGALNPNTGTMAAFRSKRDAEITKAIYRRVPVLINERKSDIVSYWKCDVTRTFDMARFIEQAKNRQQLENEGFQLHHGMFIGQEKWVPVLEAKTFWHFDHRAASYYYISIEEALKGNAQILSKIDKENSSTFVFARYWLPEQVVQNYTTWHKEQYWVAYRDITNTTNERTMIATILPRYSSDYTVRLMFGGFIMGKTATCLLSNLNSFPFDYTSRQSVAGTHFSDYIMKQMPILPPHIYTPALLNFIVPRVLELTYTAWDLQPFAQDVGYDGAPFIWDDGRRFLMRCELDALYFHLYQITREDVDYILETFPIVKRKDEAAHGEYRTKRVILEMYDQMAALPVMSVPSPKDASVGYTVPDVSQWATWLSPPPGDVSASHKI